MSQIMVFAFGIISVVGASQGISIEYCFDSESSSYKNEPSCDEGLQGTLMFHNGDISTYRAQLSSTSRPPLLVVCESKEPIQIRLNHPRIDIYVADQAPDLKRGFLEIFHYTAPDIKTWCDTGSFVRYTSETNVSYIQWIKFQSLKFFSGIVRCESEGKKTVWSELFIAPSTYPVFFHLSNPLNLFVPEIVTSNSSIVVPCIGANSSDPGTLKPELYKRSLYHSFYTNEMNEECIASLCDFMDFTDVPGIGKFRDIMGQPPMGAACRNFVRNTTGKIKDCNLDAIVSCSDAMASFPMVQDVCDTQNGLFEEGIAFTHLIVNLESLKDETRTKLNSKIEKVTDALYNDSLGFIVPKASWDHESEYLCSIAPANLTENDRIVQGYMPLDPRNKLNATLEIIGNELVCEIDQLPLKHILRKRQTQFWMLDCTSLADCDFQFRPNIGLGQPTKTSKRKDHNLVVNVDADHASSIDSNISFRLPLEFKYGLVGCTGIFITNTTTLFYARTFRYLFNGLDKHTYFVDEDLRSTSLIQLAAENTVEGESQVFTCRFSAFQFHSTCNFIIEHPGGLMKFESSYLSKAKKSGGTIGPEELNKGNNLWERTLTIELETGEYQVRCSAPRLDAAKWEEAEISVKIQQGLNVGQKVGISLAVLLLLLLLAFAAYLMYKNRRAQQIIRKLTPEEIEIFLNGELKDFDANTDSFPGSFDVEKVGFPAELQINCSDLKISESSILGEGEFGKCVRGEWKNMAVAVKIPKPSADLDYFRAFLREIKIMGYVGDHKNVVKLHGAVVDDLRNGQCSAVLELSPSGNLLYLLREYSAASGRVQRVYVNAGTSSLPPALTTVHMANFSYQIAAGMEYLAEKKVIHGDLAARNVLVFPNLTLKISDFGLSRKLYNYSMYAKKSATMLPWRWMAFESLKHLNFTVLSDVWAFGVTIWEIYTLGQTPFGGLTWNDEFLTELEGGRRPPKPVHADEKVYELMRDCWSLLATDRPTMSQVKAFFQDSVTEDNEKAYQQCTGV